MQRAGFVTLPAVPPIMPSSFTRVTAGSRRSVPQKPLIVPITIFTPSAQRGVGAPVLCLVFPPVPIDGATLVRLARSPIAPSTAPHLGHFFRRQNDVMTTPNFYMLS